MSTPRIPHSPKQSPRMLVVLALLFSGLSGCAEWKPAPPSVPGLPAAKLPPDAAVVEVHLLAMPSDDSFWNALDEASIAPETRSHLASNGLRAGLSGAELPIELLAPTNERETSSDPDGVGSELSRMQRQIHCRPGQRYEIHPRSQLSGDHILLYRGAEGIEGRQLRDPQPLLAMSVFPDVDGRVRVEVSPEVQYGAFKQQWVSKDLSMRMDARREPLLLPELQLSARLLIGQALVISPTLPPTSVGQLLLSGSQANGSTDQTVVVIRVVRRATSEEL